MSDVLDRMGAALRFQKFRSPQDSDCFIHLGEAGLKDSYCYRHNHYIDTRAVLSFLEK